MNSKLVALLVCLALFTGIFGTVKYFQIESVQSTTMEVQHEEELSQESYEYITDDPYAPTVHPNLPYATAPTLEPEIRGAFAEPMTESIKNNYTPSQILTLVTRGDISLVCTTKVWGTKVFVVDPSFVTNYAPDIDQWTFWETQGLKNQGFFSTTTDDNCELFDAYYGDLDVQLHVDAINDGIAKL